MGAVGGDEQAGVADAFGAALARAGLVILTGGSAELKLPWLGTETKDLALCGAAAEEAAGRAVARLVGVESSSPPASWNAPASGRPRLCLRTGLHHYERNVINGVTPDVLVAFGGSCGTLSEVAFARMAGRPVFFLGGTARGAVARLRWNMGRLEEGPGRKQVPASEIEANCEKFLDRALRRFPHAWGMPPPNRDLLLDLLNTALEGSDWSGSVDALVAHCMAAVPDAAGPWTSGWTGFPGLPGDQGSKARFEAAVAAM